MTQDRTYYRMLDEKLLIEAGLESGNELAIALAERLDDLTLGTDPEDLYREIRELEQSVSYYKELVDMLQSELNAAEEDY